MIFHQTHNSKAHRSFNSCFYTDEIWEYHFHKNLELIYVVEGSVKCTVNENKYILVSGSFGLCLPYDIHSYIPFENTKYWVFVFSEDYVRYFMKLISDKKSTGFTFSCSEFVKNFIVSELIYAEQPTELMLKSCLYAVCEQYLNSVELIDYSIKQRETVMFIAEYVLNNHTKNIKLSDLAKSLGYDYNYMSRNFKRLFKMNFTEFVNIYRLETALRLLDETDYNITRVALESGFQSVRTFNDLFKKQMNITPTGYKALSTNL